MNKRQSGRRATVSESRAELVERLLNPTLQVSEAANLLQVIPQTVRKWADNGELPCWRTPGGQRRFKLADVLSMEDKKIP